MLYRDCTGKKVVPTIAQGVTLGAGDKSPALRFRHGANSPIGQTALPGGGDFRRENTKPNELFEHQLSHLRSSGKNAVKKTGDWPPLLPYPMTGRLIGSFTMDRRGISRPSGDAISNHCGSTPATHETERFLPYSER